MGRRNRRTKRDCCPLEMFPSFFEGCVGAVDEDRVRRLGLRGGRKERRSPCGCGTSTAWERSRVYRVEVNVAAGLARTIESE